MNFHYLALCFALAVTSGNAQVPYTGGVYSQNFDSLSATGLDLTWTDNVTLPGWYASKTTFSATDGTIGGTAATYDSTGVTANVGMFSYGTAAATDRALGSRATSNFGGNDPVLCGLRLVNNSGLTLTRFTVLYTGEQWFKSSAAAAHTLNLDYQTGATSISSGAWTTAPDGIFTAPVATGTVPTALNGNAAANRNGMSMVVNGISWTPGTELWVRFRDANEAGNEQGLAADDFSFIADNETGLFFNGATSYVTMGQGAAAAALNASNFTIECRFMRTGPGVAASTGTGGAIALPLVAKGVSEGDGSNVDANYFLGIDSATGKLVADFEQHNATNNGTAYPAGQNFPVFGSTILQNGVFYHVAATYDTTTAIWKLYVNGVAETTTQTLPTFVGVVPRPDNIQGLGIGTTINSTGARAGFFHGVIDEARIWSIVRSPSEILANKNVKITSGVPGLLGRYGFDEGASTAAAGFNAAGTASPVGTLAGAQLPKWVNSESFQDTGMPAVALTAPAANTTILPGSTVSLAAVATDGNGTVVKVEFYSGTTKLGEDLSDPYTYDWTAVPAGSYTLSAHATDNDGNVTISTLVPITVTVATSGTLTRGPYLNQGSDTAIIVRWRSSLAVPGRVMYGDSPTNLTQTLTEVAPVTNHEVKITGLAPYTRYYYSIGSASDTLAAGADYTFRTSPAPGTATDTRIWVVGDCGRGNATQMGGRDAYYNWTGSRTPDLCLMLGDNAYNSGTDAEYQTAFFNIYPTIFRKMPLWSTIGNHEANNGAIAATSNGTVANFGTFPYYDMFTFPTAGECGGVASGSERYFSFDYGNIHIINLDSQTSDRRVAEINGADGAMATWLRSDLASTTKTWIIAMFHHPVYSKGSHNSDTDQQMAQMRTNFAPLLEAGGVDLALFGHSHSYERSVLMDGHYGVSATLTPAMKKNAGNGRTAVLNGVAPGGAYIKPLNGPRDHFGTVYTVAGSAGSADGGLLNHPVMAVSLNTVGTFNLDINGNTLVGTYIQSGGTTPDTFTLIKQGDADRDNDHIPDAYEDANGLNRSSSSDGGTTDTDGDGTTNLSEFILGQAANVPDRFNWTTTTDPVTGFVTVSFPTLVNRTYKVFYSHTLQGWLDGSGVITGNGTTQTWTDNGATTVTAPGVTPKRFYRVEASTVDL